MRSEWQHRVAAGACVGLALVLLGVAAVSCSREPQGGVVANAGIHGTQPVPTLTRTAATAAPVSADDREKMNPISSAQALRLGFTFAAAPDRSQAEKRTNVAALNQSCVACHTASDSHTMHARDVGLACVDCHGGYTQPAADLRGIEPGSRQYNQVMWRHHVRPRKGAAEDLWLSSANPKTPGARTLDESPDYVRFVNPGDFARRPGGVRDLS
jgi:hypothetical protein